MIRLVAYDLDGTVLSDANQIVGEALSALHALMDRGIAIASISGRNVEKSQEPFAADARISRSTYLGCYNGAMVLGPTENGRRPVLHEQRMPEALFRETIDFVAALGLNLVYCLCDADDDGVRECYIADRDSDPVRRLALLAGLEIVLDPSLVDRIREGALGPPPKVLILSDPETRDPVLEALCRELGDRAYIARTGTDRIEVMHPEVNKAVALRAICRAAGVPPEAAMAIGDGDNDLPMLEAAGVGVLMANADEQTLAAALRLGVRSTEGQEADGFTKAIQRYALGV